MRNDGLPEPETVLDMYTAALLDEIRGLRSDLAPKSPAPVKGETVVREPVQKEPSKAFKKL